jgi:hypothetical protein
VLVVRNAKSFPGGPPQRRSVLTASGWAAEAAQHWVAVGRAACYPAADGKMLLPTERQGRINPR